MVEKKFVNPTRYFECDDSMCRIMKYTLMKRIKHDLIYITEDFFRSVIQRKKIHAEICDPSLNLFIDKEWVTFDDPEAYRKKLRSVLQTRDEDLKTRYCDRDVIITKEFLRSHPECLFVYGDNVIRKGMAGSAILRNELNSYGFITKKIPSMDDTSFYKKEEYEEIFSKELTTLIDKINNNPDRTFLISKIGSGLANKYNIFETFIIYGLEQLYNGRTSNCIFLFDFILEIKKAASRESLLCDTGKKLRNKISFSYNNDDEEPRPEPELRMQRDMTPSRRLVNVEEPSTEDREVEMPTNRTTFSASDWVTSITMSPIYESEDVESCEEEDSCEEVDSDFEEELDEDDA